MKRYLHCVRDAEAHFRLESKDAEIRETKNYVFKESSSALSALENILETLSSEFIEEKCLDIHLSNLAYALGRLKARA